MMAREILDFWFAPESRSYWFKSTPEMDQMLRERFEAVWQDARDHKLDSWLESAEGCLALVICMDQFPLNMFRGQAASFSTEAAAREVARHAITRGFDQKLDNEQRLFLYLPFMHSENIQDQEQSVALFERAGMTDSIRWAKHHRDIVSRFGRFPHRNRILGRENSTEEEAYLQSDSAFLG